MAKTVVVALTGGLGNLLFQVAAGRRLAARRDADLLVLPPASAREATARPLLWEALGHQIPEAMPGLVRRLSSGRSWSRWGGQVSELRQKASQAFRPPGEAPLGGMIVLRGYFQHPGFLGVEVESVAELLRPWAVASRQAPPADLALHVRRGDYVARGWALPPDYYLRAVTHVTERLGRACRVVIVGDDRLAAEGLAARLVAHDRSGSDFTVEPASGVAADFAALAAARHLVMSNSTFCWWAAVVGDTSPALDSDRIVVAPDAWLGTREHALRRPDWDQLPAGALGSV